jgi:pimeloyl-ACP methyl ester carboxylesterase
VIETAQAGDVELAYETFGDPAAPPVVLVMGLGMQMLGWPLDFCTALAEEHFVVRFDNRDVGLSTHFDELPPGDPMAVLAGDVSSAAYRLSDMAADVIGLLDALGLARVHLVGASLGGMIVQAVAIEHPERVASLTSIMSTTGDRSVGTPTPEAAELLMRPSPPDREGAIERSLESARIIGSPGFGIDEAAIRERSALSYDRRYDPVGTSRQFAAILASGDRTDALRRLDVPALVIHGDADVLVGVSGGRATAAAIPGSELLVIEGMGHDLPRGAWPTIIAAISRLVQSA